MQSDKLFLVRSDKNRFDPDDWVFDVVCASNPDEALAVSKGSGPISVVFIGWSSGGQTGHIYSGFFCDAKFRHQDNILIKKERGSLKIWLAKHADGKFGALVYARSLEQAMSISRLFFDSLNLYFDSCVLLGRARKGVSERLICSSALKTLDFLGVRSEVKTKGEIV